VLVDAPTRSRPQLGAKPGPAGRHQQSNRWKIDLPNNGLAIGPCETDTPIHNHGTLNPKINVLAASHPILETTKRGVRQLANAQHRQPQRLAHTPCQVLAHEAVVLNQRLTRTRLRATPIRDRSTPVSGRRGRRAASLLWATDRDRGEPRGSAPPTPPCVRVRTRRFEKLR